MKPACLAPILGSIALFTGVRIGENRSTWTAATQGRTELMHKLAVRSSCGYQNKENNE